MSYIAIKKRNQHHHHYTYSYHLLSLSSSLLSSTTLTSTSTVLLSLTSVYRANHRDDRDLLNLLIVNVLRLLYENDVVMQHNRRLPHILGCLVFVSDGIGQSVVVAIVACAVVLLPF